MKEQWSIIAMVVLTAFAVLALFGPIMYRGIVLVTRGHDPTALVGHCYQYIDRWTSEEVPCP